VVAALVIEEATKEGPPFGDASDRHHAFCSTDSTRYCGPHDGVTVDDEKQQHGKQ
jgi:hypothetical protein